MSEPSEQPTSQRIYTHGEPHSVQFIFNNGRNHYLDLQPYESVSLSVDRDTFYIDGSHASMPSRVWLNPTNYAIQPADGKVMIAIQSPKGQIMTSSVSENASVFVGPSEVPVWQPLPVAVYSGPHMPSTEDPSSSKSSATGKIPFFGGKK